MVAIKAIPRRMLPHSIYKCSKKEIEDKWSPAEVERNEKVDYVKIESTSKVVRGKDSAEIQLSDLLFYDCKNSKPAGIEWNIDDIIEYNGQLLSVKVIEALYDNDKLHHYEIGLIKFGY